MKFLKKRRNASIIAVITVIFSILFGSARSAGTEARRVTDLFFAGNGNIYSQLQMKTNSAMSMLTIASSYGGSDLESAAENLRSSRNELLALMESDAGVSALYKANDKLQSAGEDFRTALSSRDDITEKDSNNLKNDYSTFLNAQRVMEESGYNEAVKEFDRTVLSIFPLNLLKVLIKTPELFS